VHQREKSVDVDKWRILCNRVPKVPVNM
jgi:hypothetical protein